MFMNFRHDVLLFVQLNIFLAILVDGYMSVREATEEANLSGLIDDLSDIFFHETQKAWNMIWPAYPYLSDERIISTLSPLVRELSTKKSLKEVHDQFHAVSLSSFMEIHCDYGIVIKAPRLYQMLVEYFPTVMSRYPTTRPEVAALVDPMVRSIMDRYGANYGVPDAEAKRAKVQEDFMELAELDSMRRIAELHLHQMGLPLRQLDQEEIRPVTLHVVIEQARRIPKMDLLLGADVFCVVFLDGAPELYQTEIRSGTSESDWKWDPDLSRDYTWVMAENSELLRKDRKIIVMVYDKDQISEDDLVGCVEVSLGELKDGLFDGWRKIIRPPNAPARQFIFFKPPVPELKLKVTLSTPDLDCQCGSLSPQSSHADGQELAFTFQPNSSALRPDAIFLPLFQRTGHDLRS